MMYMRKLSEGRRYIYELFEFNCESEWPIAQKCAQLLTLANSKQPIHWSKLAIHTNYLNLIGNLSGRLSKSMLDC